MTNYKQTSVLSLLSSSSHIVHSGFPSINTRPFCFSRRFCVCFSYSLTRWPCKPIIYFVRLRSSPEHRRNKRIGRPITRVRNRLDPFASPLWKRAVGVSSTRVRDRCQTKSASNQNASSRVMLAESDPTTAFDYSAVSSRFPTSYALRGYIVPSIYQSIYATGTTFTTNSDVPMNVVTRTVNWEGLLINKLRGPWSDEFFTRTHSTFTPT